MLGDVRASLEAMRRSDEAAAKVLASVQAVEVTLGSLESRVSSLEGKVGALEAKVGDGLRRGGSELEKVSKLSSEVEDGLRRLRRELAELGTVREGLAETVASAVQKRLVEAVERDVARLANAAERSQRLVDESAKLSDELGALRRDLGTLSGDCKRVHEADLTMAKTMEKVASLSAERARLQDENDRLARIVAGRRQHHDERRA